MPADVEFITAVIRAGRDYRGRDDAKAGGAGYEFSAMAIIRGGTAEIVGATGKLTRGLARDIEVALTEAGISKAKWERFNHSGPRTVERAVYCGMDLASGPDISVEHVVRPGLILDQEPSE